MTKLLLTFLASLLVLTFPSEAQKIQRGIASYYGEECRGKRTASGELFNPQGYTCASWHHPFGTLLRVRTTRHSVIVRVNDRGPNKRLHRIIDLSEAAFRQLADTKLGLIPVTIEVVK